MAKKSESALEIMVGGMNLRLRASKDEHANLLEVGNAVQKRILKAKKSGAASSMFEASVMAAFQFANELRELRDRCELSGDERDSLSQKIEDMIVRIDETMKDPK